MLQHIEAHILFPSHLRLTLSTECTMGQVALTAKVMFRST